MDDKQRIALVETRTDTPAPEQLIRYQFGNHLGSASLELDNAGKIISYEEYYPYGSTSYQAERNAVEVSLKRYRYTGMERDAETGLNYHGARYYAPWLGRWASGDPVGLGGGLNLYGYARNHPLLFTDPTGNAPAHAFNVDPNTVKQGAEVVTKAARHLKSMPAAVPAAATPAAALAVGIGLGVGLGFLLLEILPPGAYGGTGAGPYNDFPPGEGPGSRYEPQPAPPPAPERTPLPRPAPTSPVPGPAWRFDPTPPPELTAKPGPKAKVEPKPTPTPAPDPSRKPPKTDDDKNRRGQIHHIAGHQNAYSHQFAAIFANATLPGETPLGLDSPINLVRVVRHKGPHGDKYSRIVLNRLRNAVKGLEPHTAPYKEAFLQELGQLRIDINTPKHPLYNMARTSVMPAGDWANKLSVREADEYLESAANPNASRRGGNNCLLNIIPD